MNIHIGCEHKIGKNWHNYDVSYVAVFEKIPILGGLIKINSKKYPKEVKYGDISKSMLCDENEAQNIYCSHTLEHMTLESMQKSLKNIYRMLKPSGCFRVIVPDLKERVNHYIKNKNSNKLLDTLGMGKKKNDNSLIDKVRNLFGNSNHLWMYDEESLKSYLINAGFKDIKSCKFGDSSIDVFSEVEEESRFIDREFGFREVAFQCSK